MRSRTLFELGVARLRAVASARLGRRWIGGLFAVTLGVCVAGAGAQTTLGDVLTQTTLIGALPSGGGFGSGTAAGSTFAVNSQGNVFFGTSYGGQFAEYSPATGKITVLGSYSNIGPIAVDGSNNLFIGNVYSTTIVKLPFVSGAYPAFSSPGSSTPVCTGNDTMECTLPSSIVNGPYGLTSMAFDSKGDLFYASSNGGSAVDDTIFECNVACLASASPAATAVFAEPAGTSTLVGGIAFDSTGDLFFTDAVFGSAANQGNEENSSSSANELTYTGTGTTGFATTATVLYTVTAPTPLTMYNNELTSIAVGPNGTVYFATENDGIYAYPSAKGVVNTTTLYTVSTSGAKLMTTNEKGTFYTIDYSSSAGGDALSVQGVNTLVAPPSGVGGSTTLAGVIAIDNATLNCSPTPTLSITATETGTTTPYFSASANGSCTSANITGASTLPATVNFSPTTSGTLTATLTTTSSDGSTGTATVTGIATGQSAPAPTFSPGAGAYTSIQMVALADSGAGAMIYYTTDGSTPTTSSMLYSGPITVAATETINAIAVVSGDSNSSVATALYTINLPAAPAPTFTPAGGTYTTVQTVALADSVSTAMIYYTTDGSKPTTSSTPYTAPIAVNATSTINALAVAYGYSNSAVATALYTLNLPTAAPTYAPGGGTFNAVQSITLLDATPGAVIYYTTNGTTPTTMSTVYTAPIPVTSTEMIQAVALAPGFTLSPVTPSTYTINLPTFGLAINPGTLTMAPGTPGLVNVTVTGLNSFNGTVTFTCAGLPAGATCTFTPTSVMPNGSYTATTVLAINVTPTTAALEGAPGSGLLSTVTLAFALGLFGWRKRRGARLLMLLCISTCGLFLLSGCSSNGNTTQAMTTSTITVTATAAATVTSPVIVQSSTFQLVVQ